jgi:hypothetical protein
MSNPTSRSWMRCTRATLVTLALCGPVLAENVEPLTSPTPAATPKVSPEAPRRSPRPSDVQRVFVLHSANADSVARVLSVFPATISSSVGMKTVGVSAAPPVMAAIEETVKRLDVPPTSKKSVEVTAYIIQALAAPAAESTMPAVLDPVVAQLRNTFRYADYRLVDTLIARSVADSQTKLEASSFSEAAIWPRGGAKYRLVARPVVLTADRQRVVRMEQLIFTFDVPIEVGEHNYQFGSSGISANVDIGDRQYVVVGKAGTGQPGSALILVLSAKIVD